MDSRGAQSMHELNWCNINTIYSIIIYHSFFDSHKPQDFHGSSYILRAPISSAIVIYDTFDSLAIWGISLRLNHIQGKDLKEKC